MLNKTMWNIFEETGNIYAYLYVRECNKYSYNKNEANKIYTDESSRMKEITIVT